MKKNKNKNQKPSVTKKSRRTRNKSYPVHLLAIAIAVLVTVESLIAFGTTSNDWKQGFAILDVSEGVTSMVSDVSFVAQPAVSAIASVNEFYKQAAVATNQLLAPTATEDPMMFVYGVNDFYNLAADELAGMLDISNVPKIAGTSISVFSK